MTASIMKITNIYLYLLTFKCNNLPQFIKSKSPQKLKFVHVYPAWKVINNLPLFHKYHHDHRYNLSNFGDDSYILTLLIVFQWVLSYRVIIFFYICIMKMLCNCISQCNKCGIGPLLPGIIWLKKFDDTCTSQIQSIADVSKKYFWFLSWMIDRTLRGFLPYNDKIDFKEAFKDSKAVHRFFQIYKTVKSEEQIRIYFRIIAFKSIKDEIMELNSVLEILISNFTCKAIMENYRIFREFFACVLIRTMLTMLFLS